MADNRDEKTQKLVSNGPGLSDFLPDTSNGYIAKAGTALSNPLEKPTQLQLKTH